MGISLHFTYFSVVIIHGHSYIPSHNLSKFNSDVLHIIIHNTTYKVPKLMESSLQRFEISLIAACSILAGSLPAAIHNTFSRIYRFTGPF